MLELSGLNQISDLLAFALCALLVGMGKAGIKGLGMLVVPMLAIVFGGKASVGLLLPMLNVADLMAVSYYRRHARWSYVLRLLPMAVVGVLLGVWVGDQIDDALFRPILAAIVLGSLALLIYQEKRPPADWMVEHRITGGLVGLLGGFSTMIGNAAGPILAVFLLSARLPKNAFIGTAAWFFLLINIFKLPFHIFVWETITVSSLYLDLLAIPVILIGFVIGTRIVRWIPEQSFRYFVMIMTTLAAIRLIIG
jgi:hypothetical protein